MTRIVWNGVAAHYTPMEHATMTALRRAGASPAELAFLHQLKATFDAREIHWLNDRLDALPQRDMMTNGRRKAA